MEGMVALEGMYGWECRRQMGCCSLALPSPPCHGPMQEPPLSSEALLPVVFLAPSLLFHLVFILSPLSGLSCPGTSCLSFPVHLGFGHHSFFQLGATKTFPLALGLYCPPPHILPRRNQSKQQCRAQLTCKLSETSAWCHP